MLDGAHLLDHVVAASDATRPPSQLQIPLAAGRPQAGAKCIARPVGPTPEWAVRGRDLTVCCRVAMRDRERPRVVTTISASRAGRNVAGGALLDELELVVVAITIQAPRAPRSHLRPTASAVGARGRRRSGCALRHSCTSLFIAPGSLDDDQPKVGGGVVEKSIPASTSRRVVAGACVVAHVCGGNLSR